MSEPRDRMADETEDGTALWRRWTAREAAGEAPDALTLAAFVEGRLDAAARDAVAAYLALDPELAADLTAAEAAAAAPLSQAPDASLAAIIARASALVPDEAPADAEPASGARIIAFPAARRAEPGWRFAARWGALAASFAMVSYLGFALGIDASANLASLSQTASSGFTDEVLDPPSGFLGTVSDASGA